MYKNKNTADKCKKKKSRYPDSHTCSPTQSFSSVPPWLEAGFSVFFFFFCNQCSSQCWNPKLFTFESQENCRVRKKELKAEHIPCDEPKLPMWNVWQSISSDTQTLYVHVWWLLSPLIFFCVFLRWSLGLWTNNRTRHAPKHTKILYLEPTKSKTVLQLLHAVTEKKQTGYLKQTDAFQTGFSQKYTKIYI